MSEKSFVVSYKYWDKTDYVFGKVRVTVDPEAIGSFLGPKARKNKSKVAKEIGGCVVVEIIS